MLFISLFVGFVIFLILIEVNARSSKKKKHQSSYSYEESSFHQGINYEEIPVINAQDWEEWINNLDVNSETTKRKKPGSSCGESSSRQVNDYQENIHMNEQDLEDWIHELQDDHKFIPIETKDDSSIDRKDVVEHVENKYKSPQGVVEHVENKYKSPQENSVLHPGPTCGGKLKKKEKHSSARSRCHDCSLKDSDEKVRSFGYEFIRNRKKRVDTYCSKCNKPYCERCFPFHEKPTSRPRMYKKHVIKNWLIESRQTASNCGGTLEEKEIPLNSKIRCYECSVNKRKISTNTYCSECKVPYCIKCFPEHVPPQMVPRKWSRQLTN